MLSRDMNDATAGMSGFVTSNTTTVLRMVNVAGQWLYRGDTIRKCRQCRNLPSHHAHATGARVCVCGNPYVNMSSVTKIERQRDRQERGIAAGKRRSV
jgi:hypothetical protein